MGRVNQLNDENIIIVTNNVAMTAEVVEDNRTQCRALIADMEGPVVLIIDYRDAVTSFAETVNIMKGNQSGKRADLNQRTFTIMVGTDQVVNMYRDSMRLSQMGGVNVPLFEDMDIAIETARHYLTTKQKEEND